MSEKIDRKRHLCDTCELTYPECSSTIVEFGDGVGNDNIIKCNCYTEEENDE